MPGVHAGGGNHRLGGGRGGGGPPEALAELHQSLDQEVQKEMAEAEQAAAQEGLDEKGLEVHEVPMVVHHRGHGLENQLGLVEVLR